MTSKNSTQNIESIELVDSINDSTVTKNLPYITEAVATDTSLLNRSDYSSLTSHNKQYTELLETYVDNAKTTLKNKRKQKEILYYTLIVLLCVITVTTLIVTVVVLILIFLGKTDAVKLFALLSTVLTTFITSYVSIMKVITTYLFNKEEEKSMTDVVAKIQDYDINVRNKIKG